MIDRVMKMRRVLLEMERNMSHSNKIIYLTAIIFLLIVTLMSLFVVNETERALTERLGNWVVDPKTNKPQVLGPGLHAKIPLIDTVRLLDKRIQTLEIQSSRIPTLEKKELIVDLFTKWRINDFALYSMATNGDRKRADQILRNKIVDGLRGEFGRRMLNDVVFRDRQVVMDKIRQDTNKTAKTIGVEVVDARIVRIDLPQEVSESTFNLMRTERQRVAAKHRAQGRSMAEAIRADADAKEIIIGATAESEANQMRGAGDSIAAKIYSDVYGMDPEFYSFYRSLEAYRETFKGKDDMLVIKPDDAFFKYFRRSQSSMPSENRKS